MTSVWYIYKIKKYARVVQWLERCPDPPALTSPICEHSSVAERRPDKTEVDGSIPSARTRQGEVGRGKTEAGGSIPPTRTFKSRV